MINKVLPPASPQRGTPLTPPTSVCLLTVAAACSQLQPGQCAVAPDCNQLILTPQPLAKLMSADGEQLLSPAGSAAVSADDPALSGRRAEGAEGTSLVPPPTPFPSKSQCGSSGLLLHDGICSAASSGWFRGMLRVCPLPLVGQWSGEGYQSPVEGGAGSGLRGSCLIGQSRGALSLSHG